MVLNSCYEKRGQKLFLYYKNICLKIYTIPLTTVESVDSTSTFLKITKLKKKTLTNVDVELSTFLPCLIPPLLDSNLVYLVDQKCTPSEVNEHNF